MIYPICQATPTFTPRVTVNSPSVSPSRRLLDGADDDNAQYATYPPIETDSGWKGMVL